MSDKHLFWIDNPSILYNGQNLTKIIPMNNMTRVEQLNAITRLFIYLLIVLLLLGKLDAWIFLPIIGIVFIVVLYNVYFNEKLKKQNLDDFKNNINKNHHNIKRQRATKKNYNETKSNKSTKLRQCQDNKNYRNSARIDEIDHTLRHSKNDYECDNGNMLINTLINYPVACNCDDKDIVDQNDRPDQDLYTNLDTKITQRIWDIVPDTIRQPDLPDFANRLRMGPTCKEDQYACLPPLNKYPI